MHRRTVLRGAGGLALALPFLEGLAPRSAQASEGFPPFAIFFRQANGVACEQQTQELGSEPERFWPTQAGPLTAETVAGRALDELGDHLGRLLVLDNVNAQYFDYGSGHANGALQGLTARGPVVPGAGDDSEADGESIDNRIARELNSDGRDSLFLYAGAPLGYLGGACISYRGPNDRRAAIGNPVVAYAQMMGIDESVFVELAARRKSVNDLVRAEMQSLLARPELSSADRERLQLHFDSIRDLEGSLACNLEVGELAVMEGLAPGYESYLGDEVLAAAKAHMHVAALAVACGYTRSVAIQVGNGNDGTTRYTNLDDGSLMENFHYVSHRRLSHGSSGEIIPNADLLHHHVDRQFARAFAYLLDLLAAYPTPAGSTLADAGFAAWYNDLGNGPGHAATRVPWIVAGSAGGFLVQGRTVELLDDGQGNHAKLLCTLGSAAGLRNAEGDPISDFGDPALPRGTLHEILA
jgi:hypothetical protein